MNEPQQGAVDLAGEAYWDGIWRRSAPRSLGRLNYFHHAFARVLDSWVSAGTSVCEAGCANSVWIPHLARRKARVFGVDYSEPGLRRLAARMRGLGLSATLLRADITTADPFGGRHFDVVFSLGLVEHFADPLPVMRTLAASLAPGGVMITVVPNLEGLWGRVQQRLDRKVFDLHVRYGCRDLDRLHEVVGLEPIERARFLGTFGPLLLHSAQLAEHHPFVNRALTALVWCAQQAVAWPVSLVWGRRAEGRCFSPLILGIYRRVAMTEDVASDSARST